MSSKDFKSYVVYIPVLNADIAIIAVNSTVGADDMHLIKGRFIYILQVLTSFESHEI